MLVSLPSWVDTVWTHFREKPVALVLLVTGNLASTAI